MQGKSYGLSRELASASFGDLIQRMLGHAVEIDLAGPWNRQGPVFGDPRLAPQRLGQQAVKASVLVADGKLRARHYAGKNGLVRVVVTRIDPDGAVHRRMVDTAQQTERQLWEDLAARAVGGPVSYRPALGIAVYHISVDDDVVIAAEHDLIGSLRDLVTAVMALGGEL